MNIIQHDSQVVCLAIYASTRFFSKFWSRMFVFVKKERKLKVRRGGNEADLQNAGIRMSKFSTACPSAKT